NLGLEVSPSALAYVIYTSGSTGAPKGVGVAHAQATAHCRAAAAVYGLTPADRVLHFAAVGFDVSLEQLLAPLSAGACVVLRGAEVPTPIELARQAVEQGMTVINPPTAYWHQLVAEPAALELLARSVRLVIAGGEAMSPAAARDWAAGPTAGVRLLNAYGPTETVVTCAAYEVPASLPEGAVHVPVGRPLPGRAAYVLDGRLSPAPLGVPGELCIGGIVARGYLGRPAATAEAFVPDPFSPVPGARMYRTGDRARWLAAGELEFLGRRDHQVKVRGFRIELGEIEARLAEHPGVREAVVRAREDAPGEKRLVAYLVGDEGAGAEVLRAHLGQTLPEYMVPAAFVRLEGWPLTPNGKLDRKALPAPDADARAAREYAPPVGATEQALAEIWAEVLRVERVGRHDHFFELGGHSLLAVQVISRVRQVLVVEVALGELFTRPVLADFARGLETAARAELPPIEPAPREGRIPLSFAQQRLWFLEQLGGLGSTYHLPTRLRLRGELDRAAMGRALDAIVARHESLRTTFAEVDGVPEQRIAPADTGFRLREHDLAGTADAKAELNRLMAEEAGAPFDLERGPLIRGRLVRLAADDHVLLLTMHHIVSDGWSTGVLTRELRALYAAFRRGAADPLPPLPVQYADYAVWQRRWVEGEVLRGQAEYWTRTLAGAPELLELPTDHPRPAEQDHAGAWLGVVLDEELTAGLKALSRRHGTTLFMTLLAGWATLLSRLSGQDDVVVGTPAAGRGRREIEGLIGFFVNTLALRVELADAPSVAELLGRVKERALEAQHHQDIPFEQVVERVRPVRSLAHSPLFQVMFSWQNLAGGGGRGFADPAPPGPGAPALAPLPAGDEASATAHFDLSLTLSERGGRISGALEYATALFERETIERSLAYLCRVLHEMVADERRSVARLPLLPAAECRRMVEEWNPAGGGLPAAACVHHAFEAQVARTPDAVAVVFQGERLTYAELDRRANRLAHHLGRRGVGPEVAVGVGLDPHPELVVALLATLKAGGVYVPLDPTLPAGRLAYVAEDAGLRAVVTRDALAGRVPSPVTVRVDADAERIAAEPDGPPAPGVAPANLAYLIYTSGSTGRPKGVAVEHGAAAAHFAAMRQARGIAARDTV
ncbi:MAG TPA: amino acid adenylation domain-containing protein, partial [Longimicrobium sp.]|nr:amino acid adenylation domain-containing protein [Longimicrobium sp.]